MITIGIFLIPLATSLLFNYPKKNKKTDAAL